jgi:hypothetical protein
MLVYEFRNRLLHFLGETRPSFPAKVEISTALAPPVPFGDGIGPTRTTAHNAEFVARPSPSSGRFILEAKGPLFEPLSATSESSTESFAINGRTATVRATVDSIQEVADLLGALNYALPAVLNLEIPDAPYSLYSWGAIGGVKFQWHYHPQELRAGVKVVTKELQEQSVLRSWQRVRLIRRNPRLFMSFHYFRTACRLLMSGQHRFEFMGEAVLNLAKCLQALGGESRESVRDTLRQLDIDDEATEALYIPAMLLRDRFNVAHVNLTQYTPGQLRTLHTYVELAEDAFRRLLVRAMEYHEAGRFTPSSHAGIVDRHEADVLERLEKNLARFEAEAAGKAVALDQKAGIDHPAFAMTAPPRMRTVPPDS